MTQKTLERITREEIFFSSAELWAKRSTCLRGQVGVIVTRDKRVIASGYNGAPMGEPHCSEVGCLVSDLTEGDYKEGRCLRTVHAEASLISFCAKEGIALAGTEMWSTHSPCPECSKLILNAGVSSLHFLQLYLPTEGVFMLCKRIKVFEGREGQIEWSQS